MHKELSVGVGEGITLQTPLGDITVTVAKVGDGEVGFEVLGPEEVLAALGDAELPLARAA